MKNLKTAATIPALCVMLSAGVSNASTVAIVNGGFEQTNGFTSPFTTLSAGSGEIAGWLIGGAGVDHIGSHWDASEETYSLDLNAGAAGSVSQQVDNLVVGDIYQVSFDMATNPDGGAAVKFLTASIAGFSEMFENDGTGNTTSDMGWVSHSFLFTATASTEWLTFAGIGNSAFGAALDNVSIMQTPVPGALLLFGTALGALGIVRSRRKPTPEVC